MFNPYICGRWTQFDYFFFSDGLVKNHQLVVIYLSWMDVFFTQCQLLSANSSWHILWEVTLLMPHFKRDRFKINWKISIYIWVFPKIGIPQNGWFIMENPINMDDLGVPPFKETPPVDGFWKMLLECSPRNLGKTHIFSTGWRVYPLPSQISQSISLMAFNEGALARTVSHLLVPSKSDRKLDRNNQKGGGF